MKKRLCYIIVVTIVVVLSICNVRYLVLRSNLYDWLNSNPVCDTRKEFRVARSYDKYQIAVSEDDIFNSFGTLVRNISVKDLYSRGNYNNSNAKLLLIVGMVTAENEECLFEYYDDGCVYLIFDQETSRRFGDLYWSIKNDALSDYCSKVIQ